MKASETLKTAQATLSSLGEHLSAIADLAERQSAADSAIVGTTKEQREWHAKTAAAKAEIEAIKQALAGNSGVFDDGKARTLKALRDQVALRTDELEQVNRELKSKTAAYDKLVASMGALTKEFAA
jgi:uncharacterized protein involved in exopolysaccharide biosynthesis